MTTINTLSFLITLLAFPIGRILLQHYLREPGAIIGDTLAAIAGKKLDDARARGQLERSFQEIAEQVCERLAPSFVDTTSKSISLEAVAREVQATLDVPASAKLFIETDLSGYLRKDLDPARITAGLKSARPLPIGRFSQAEIALYDRALDEAVRYIVEVAASLPEFHSAAIGESLQRLRSIQRGIDSVLDTVQRIERSVVEQADPFTRFEADYRQALIRNLDYVELFGVDLSDEARYHALSVAYVSLRLVSSANSPDDEEDDAPARSVEDVLAALRTGEGRLLVRGHAGAGKSTLFRWIAIEAAKAVTAVMKSRRHHRATAEQEDRDDDVEWQSRIPFLVRLRDCDAGRLPAPEELPASVAREIGRPPEDWVRSVLQEGQGFILLDGVDEVPHAHHEDLRRAVAALVGAYPKCFFLVSTRPTAVPAGWLQADGFREAELDAMLGSDIQVFVKRWHDAVGEKLRQQGRMATDLDAISNELLAKLGENSAISRLASNPLLCAMICALHRERNRELPESRAALCDALCLMLLHRRDRESGLRTEAAPEVYRSLGVEHKRALVERLSEHMVLNGLSSVSFDTADEQIAAELRQFPLHAAAPASDVRRGLVNRSGMLREVRRGHLDFLHNTLKEYLAAERFVDRGDIGLLAKNALDSAWREVVLFAVATTRRDMVATELIRHLLDGESTSQLPNDAFQNEPLRSRALFALRCRSMAFRLAPELHSRMDQIAARLFPPRTMEEAEALAAAGDAAVPYLRYIPKTPAQQASACARTLRLIGTRAATQALWSYGDDDRATVAVEVAQIHEPLSLPSVQRRIFGGVSQTRSIRALVKSLEPLTGRADVTSLHLSGTEVSDFSPLRTLASLRFLELSHLKHVTNIDWLSTISSLESLQLNMTPVEDLSPLKQLSRLKWLSLWATRVSDLGALSELTSLTHLDLNSTAVSDLSPLRTLVGIKRLQLSGTKVTDIGPLSPLVALEVLNLANTRVTDIGPLAGLLALTNLTLNDTPLSDISVLSKLVTLHSLSLEGTSLADLGSLRGLTSLTYLDISRTAVADLSPLAGLKSLKMLSLRQTKVVDVSHLLSIESLSYLAVDQSLRSDPTVAKLLRRGVSLGVY